MSQTPTNLPRYASKVPASSVVGTPAGHAAAPMHTGQSSTPTSLPKISLMGSKPPGNTTTAASRPTLVFAAPKSQPASPATPSSTNTNFSVGNMTQKVISNARPPSVSPSNAARATSTSSPAARHAQNAARTPTLAASRTFSDSDDDDVDIMAPPSRNQRLPPPRAPSSRSNARRSYENFADDYDEGEYDVESVEEDEVAADDGDDDSGLSRARSESPIDKILGHRRIDPAILVATVVAPKHEDAFEYLIKWRGKSFLHTTWVSADYLRSLGPGGRARLLKYWKARPSLVGTPLDDDDALTASATITSSSLFSFFPAEYIEVERIIAEKVDSESSDDQNLDVESMATDAKPVTKFLVKWAGLPYAEATWETAEDIKDDEAIEKFRKRNAYSGPITYPPPPAANTFKRMTKSPVFKDGNELRAYQLEGLNWLAFNWYHRRGCILADEMGLGKTVQSISFLDFLFRNEKIPGPFLAIVPLSTIGHWQREIESWTEMNVIVYSGNKETRQIIREHEWLYAGTQQIKFHVLLTTYEMLMADDWTELARVPWKCCVIDEAQRLKNSNSKLGQNLKHFRIAHRILLTGTPIQNNTTELWSLLNVIAPEQFSSRELFVRRFGNLHNKEQVDELHRVLKPFLLRRLKGDVEKSIPPKEETIVEVELSRLQKQYYRAILDRNRTFLNKGLSQKNTPNLVNVMMQLRKVCNHPYLIKGCEENDLTGVPVDQHMSKLIAASSKLVFLDKLLPKLREGGHKVLIFSQMVRVLDILEQYLHIRGHKYERLDGGVRGNDRQAAIDRFCNPDSDRFVFLLCTRAGGVGINLAAADTVVIFDSDWNPQNDIQAQARAHRIGQTAEVKVYRLLTAKTYERGMFERASRKLGLDQAVLSNLGVSSDPSKALDDKEIDLLLKYGAYDLFRSANEEQEQEELDLDKVLERSQKFVWNNPESSSGGQSSFSKAHFQLDKDESGVDLTAPNFWDQILPDSKSVRELEKALENSAAVLVSDPKEKAKFMSTLESRVTEFLRDWQQGAQDMDDAEGLIRVLGISRQQHLDRQGGVFSPEEYDKLGTWLDEVTHPKRKRRTAASNAAAIFSGVASANEAAGDIVETGIGVGEGDDDDNYTRGSSSSAAAGGSAASRSQWSRAERVAFHDAFLSTPDSRWCHIQTAGSNNALMTKTLEEIYQYARRFLQTCVQMSTAAEEKDDSSVFQEYLDGLVPPSRQEVDQEIARNGGVDRTSITKPSMSTDPAYKKSMTKKLKTWARRLRFLSTLRNTLLTATAVATQKFEAVDAPSVSSAEEVFVFTMDKIRHAPLLYPTRPLAKWWTRAEDRNLLLGTFKHGFGRYEPMLRDPELSFHQFLDRIHAANAQALALAQQKKQDTAIKQDDSTPASFEADCSVAQGIPSKTEPTTSPAEAQRVLATTSGPEDLLRVSAVFSETDLSQAAPGDPLRLRFRITHMRSHLQDQWPDGRTLDSHVKFLLEQLRAYVRGSTTSTTRRRPVEKDETKKKALLDQKKEERQKVWTKREEKELRSAIMMFGGGYWEVLRIQAGLDLKAESQVTEYFYNLMAICRRLSSDPAVAARAAQDGDGGDDDDASGSISAAMNQTPGLSPLDKVSAWPVDPSDLLSGGNALIPGPNQPALAVTPTMARRYLRRVTLFQDIRTKVLVHEDLRTRLQAARLSDVPPWWVPVVTDVALLEAVIKYGIGGQEQWEEFLADPECPLFAIDADGRRAVVPIQTQEVKRAFFKEFLVDKSPLLSRLEMLVQTVVPPPSPVASQANSSPLSSSSTHVAAKIEDTYSSNPSGSSTPSAGSASGRVSTRSNGKRKNADGEYGAPDAKRSKHGSADGDDSGGGRATTRAVPRDESGSVILPITAKGATIVSLGRIVHDRPNYHARNYIWPVGFKSTRKMPSIKNPQQQVIYTSEIVDNGDSPGFRVTPADAPELSMTFNTASRVWMEMLRRIKRRQTISVSGPETYGYSDSTVRMLIQELDGAELCESYQWINFEGSWTKEDKLARAAGRPFSAPNPAPAPPRRASSGKSSRQKSTRIKTESQDFEEDEVSDYDEDDDTEQDSLAAAGKFPVAGASPSRQVPQKQPKTVISSPPPTQGPGPAMKVPSAAAVAAASTPVNRLEAEQQLRDLNDRLAKIQQRQELLKSNTGSPASPSLGSPKSNSLNRQVPKPLSSLPAPTHGLEMVLDDDDHGMAPIDAMDIDHHSDVHMHKAHNDIAVSVARDASMTPIDHLGDMDPLPVDLDDEEMQMMIENFD